MKKILIVFFLGGISFLNAQSIFGKWKTIDDETGKARSIVQIYEEGGKVFGKIVDILQEEKKNKKCIKCKGEKKDKPIMGLVIMEGLVLNDNTYEDGIILDPGRGKEYKCKIWVDEDDSDVLNVRGYIAFLYRTQQWIRVK
ncbi:DUF2147 domain-containing protein [Abyssalbus ytuae]|uniref:DUF2147 domain-containing protein n=1 Tax=Abyssalbus ytuae TaxID=2926907 RepID=A0A9E6ZQY8_9FLAO|nr:DUF2147 domain-containing protein [Abyssalbus ytuae]UOB17178.1 DUF2147 domain-containing protein [Abyssalbus ytuae]